MKKIIATASSKGENMNQLHDALSRDKITNVLYQRATGLTSADSNYLRGSVRVLLHRFFGI